MMMMIMMMKRYNIEILHHPKIGYSVPIKLAAHEAFTSSISSRKTNSRIGCEGTHQESHCRPARHCGRHGRRPYAESLPEAWRGLMHPRMGNSLRSRNPRGRRPSYISSAAAQAWRRIEGYSFENSICPGCHASGHRSRFGNGSTRIGLRRGAGPSGKFPNQVTKLSKGSQG